jgi:hypothetical protein
VDGGGQNGVVGVWEVMAEATTSVEGRFQGTGINGLLYAPVYLVAFFSKVGDVGWAEMVTRCPSVLTYERCVIIRVGQFHPVMMFFKPDAHCSLCLSYISGRTRAIGLASTWGVVNYG